MDHPFCSLTNFLGSPHNSSMVPGVIPKATVLAAQNVLKFLHGEEIRGVVSREQYL
jgi:phosphoglycerate dehydrogenase-like enzyme